MSIRDGERNIAGQFCESRTLACKSVTIFTAADTPLRADATIALTVVPPIQGHIANALVPIAWKVLTFHAHVSEQRQFRLYPARRITEVFVHSGDQTDQQFVTYSDNGAGLGPNQHLALESGRWTSDPLFDIPPDTSFAINRDIEDHLLSIGSSSPGIPFEPMILLPALKHKQGALFRYPCQLQAWEVESRCVVGQLLTDRGPGLFTVEGDPSPIDAGMLAGDVGFKLYTDCDGRLALETIQPRQILILHPEPLPLMIPRSSVFSDALATPPQTPSPPLPRSTANIRSPIFFQPLYTPPGTPQVQLSPSLQPTIRSPVFLSPLLTPAEDSIFIYA